MNKIGIYNPYLETKGGGEKVCLALAETLSKDPNNSVTFLTHDKVDLTELAEYFNLDLSRITITIIKHNRLFSIFLNKLHLPQKLRGVIVDYQTLRAIRKLKLDLFINNCYQSGLSNAGKKGVYMCMFPQRLPKDSRGPKGKAYRQVLVRILTKTLLHPGKEHFFETYDVITANSEFTQGYIKKYWGVESKILYPICEDMKPQKSVAKDKVILNVGRFFADTAENHNKRQDFLIKTFISMTELHKAGWELHFAGTVAKNEEGMEYILDLLSMADGYPVFFHFNASFQKLKNLYATSSVYWHATGYGVSATEYPEKQEHFGIVTVESMSAGCVPVVINTAGQKEIITDGVNGFLWDTPEQLAAKTKQTTSLSSSQFDKMRKASRETFALYDHTAFAKSVTTIFDELLS